MITRDELEAALAELAREVRDPHAGILGPDSVAWRLGGDLAVFLGGGRAALLQLAHPMVAYAIAHHSRTRDDIVGRFQRTFRNVFAMVFGELGDAVAAARRVHAIHARVHGTIPVAVGPWRAGAPYHANDVGALRWVHATLVDTTLVVRERLGGPLPRAVLDAYVIEMNRFAALFGIPRARLPASFAEHADYVSRMLGTLAVAPVARDMAMFLVGRGEQAPQPSLGRLTELVTATMLPRHLVRDFGLVEDSLATAGIHAVFTTLAPFYNHLPKRLVAIPARSDAQRRVAGRPPSRLAAWTERQLFGLSRQVTGR